MAMDQTIKQRLIGAIVLVALAIIFLPGILGQKKQQSEFSSQIPKKPETLKKQLNLPKSQSVNETTPSSDSEVDETASGAEITKPSSDKSSTTEKFKSEHSKSTPGNAEKTIDTDSSSKSSTQTDKVLTDPVKQTNTIPAAQQTDKTKPKTDSKPAKTLTKSSWLVQVGSFSSNDNANALVKKLEANQLKAFARPATLDNGKVLYRVYVGPWLEKKQAEQRMDKVRTITQLNPIVIAWDPTKH